MAFDRLQCRRPLRGADIGQAAHVALLGGIPVDAVAALAQLRLGQQVGRTVAQAAADHGQQLAGDGVQGIAAHTQRSHAQTRRQDQSRAFAHSMKPACSSM